MTNEAVIRDRLENPIDFTIADGTAIEKGVLLELQDARTAIAVTDIGRPLAGIAAREKVASDGRTQLAVYRKGIFDMYASGAILVGAPVAAEGGDFTNYVIATTTASGAAVLGHAFETATDGEQIQIYVNIGGGVV